MLRRLSLVGLALIIWVSAVAAADAVDGLPGYQTVTPSRDGIGKLYLGREISQVMGHRGAAWLERQTRAQEELPDALIERLDVAPDAVVADIGAGTGYFSFRLSRVVPDGRVLAVDIQPEMLAILRARGDDLGVTNVVPLRGEIDEPKLPEGGVDAVLMVDAYHEFEWPREMGMALVSALRPGGTLVLVEYRGEDPSVPIKRLHKMTRRQAIDEMQAVGLNWERTERFLPQQHFMVFRRP